MIELNARERAVLAHVVIDPDLWLSHSVSTFEEDVARQHLNDKVSRHAADYDSAVAAQGAGYQTRAERAQELDGA
jgi:O-methyltransferase involved in polyketide biosynthesis